MAITIPHSFTSGTIAEAAEVNANTNAIANYVNGLSDGTNIDLSAIVADKIASNAITTSKIADGSVTYIKLDSTTVSNGVSQDDQVVLASQVFG
jgi:hypothetical protein